MSFAHRQYWRYFNLTYHILLEWPQQTTKLFVHYSKPTQMGNKKLVWYWYHSLNQAEKGYYATERELLVVLWALNILFP